MNFGFGRNETLLTSIDVPKTVDGDMVTLNAKVTWLVCHDICIPEMKDFTLTLPVTKDGVAAEANQPEIFTVARAAIPVLKSWQGSIEEIDQGIIVKFQLDEDGKTLLTGAKDFFFFPC